MIALQVAGRLRHFGAGESRAEESRSIGSTLLQQRLRSSEGGLLVFLPVLMVSFEFGRRLASSGVVGVGGDDGLEEVDMLSRGVGPLPEARARTVNGRAREGGWGCQSRASARAGSGYRTARCSASRRALPSARMSSVAGGASRGRLRSAATTAVCIAASA